MIQRWSWTWLALSAAPLLAVLARVYEQPSMSRVERERYAAAYALRLDSDWPVYPRESEACNNRGAATLEGTVRRTANGRYVGRFVRRTRLGFCGAHGREQVTSCALQLDGRDTVAVDAVAFEEGRGPELRLRWQSMPGTSAVTVGGTCSERFEEAMTRMYLAAAHEVELSVAPGRVGRGRLRLGDYPWLAAVTRLRARDTLGLPSIRPVAGP